MKKLFIATALAVITIGSSALAGGTTELNAIDRAALKSDYVDYLTLSLGTNKRSDENVSGLPSWLSGKTDNDWGQSAFITIGKEVAPQIDVELEVGVNQNDGKLSLTKSYRRYSRTYTTDYDIAAYNVGINTRYNIEQVNLAGITPNVLIGVGVESVHFDNGTFGGSDTGVYGQVGAGLEKPINDDFSIIADYRYRKGQDLNFNGFEVDNDSQTITIGGKLKL